MRLWAAVLLAAVLLAGCGGTGIGENAKETGERGSEAEETRFVTQMVTVEETTPSEGGAANSEAANVSQGRSPEDILALQYEYINRGDYAQAYSLFDDQSRREVSLVQYEAFFEANAPYSVTDYSFSDVRTSEAGDSATVDATFTASGAAGSEQLQRTQQFVRESGEWRVVMRPEQVSIFTAGEAGDTADIESAPTTKKAPSSSGKKQSEAETQTVTIQIIGPDGETFSGSYGVLGSQRSVDGTVPAEYDVEVETGFLSFDSTTAVMQKRSPGPWEMTLRFVVDGEVVEEQSTTAEFGVVSLSYRP